MKANQVNESVSKNKQSVFKKYFNWLQYSVPTGEVERYPEIDSNGETSVKGIYVIGDLTGIPLLKLASESGKKLLTYLINDEQFKKERSLKRENDIYDLIIIGAGPSGIAAGIEAVHNNLTFKIIESAQRFNTIINFPKGKPIYAEPSELQQESELIINDGTKESLLDELYSQSGKVNLPIEEGLMVEKIEKKAGYLEVVTKEINYKALRVILAIGKSGNSRMLNVPGENLPKVFNRLFDPADAQGQDVLVVGGGDSAIETAVAVADYANSTTISYRKAEFSRPKEGNVAKLNSYVNAGKIHLLMESNVKEILPDKVILTEKNGGEKAIENTMIFSLIGKELPLQFFKRSGIKTEGELSGTSKLQFLLLILFAGVLYFGKSSALVYKYLFGQSGSFAEVCAKVFSFDFISKFLTLPFQIAKVFFSNEIRLWNVVEYVNAFIAYFSFISFAGLGIYLLANFVKSFSKNIEIEWKTFKYIYFILVGGFIAFIFFGERYFSVKVLNKSQSFWYTGLYSLTILIFGLRRIKMKPTRYIKFQTWTLILIQAFPLFLFPEVIFPWLGKLGTLGTSNGFILTQVFPHESHWRSYGFILAWPLNLGNLYNGNITAFWLVFSLFQSFILIPFIVYKWGKGAYCGWICSCGALAETLGDEYRTLALHGPMAKKWENFGQYALLFAFVITAFKLSSILYNFNVPVINENISRSADFFYNFYHFGIDIIFAGVLGVGVYFFLSGRVWCRFGCPLAALMHIYSRFSKYRIFAEKKKCISCNMCTKVCHMGIDVMNYANKGIPMNDVECVRCSACIVNCPTQVLSFGSLPKTDLGNRSYKKINIPTISKTNWRSGL